MLGLPEGWESDYDGQRWFYRFKANGLTQFQFPQPGDEFPSFVGDDGELEPEERLASELQLRQRNAHGDTKRNNSGRKKTVEGIEDDEFSMGATGYFDPSSFMYFGPEESNDAGSKADERGIEAEGTECKAIEESSDNAVDQAQSPEPTPSTVNSELATNRPLASDESSEPENVAAELPSSNERKRSPLGLIAELAGSHTVKCADELAPVELDATPAMRPDVAELPADSCPVKRRTPQPRPPPTPMQSVDSYPLVSASFAYPPLGAAENSAKSSTRVEEPQPQKQTDVPSEEGRTSPDKTQVKYQPFMPGQQIGESKKDPQRSSMVLASMTVLQTQNSELGPLGSIAKRKAAAESIHNDSGKHELSRPPVDPRRPESTSPPKAAHPSESDPRSPQVPPKIPIDQPSPGHPPLPSSPPPLPGSGARHESISYPGPTVGGNRNADLSHAPSILKPAHRRSYASFPQSQHAVNQPPYPTDLGQSSRGSSPQVVYSSRNPTASHIRNSSDYAMERAPPVIPPVAPLRPRKSPSPGRGASAPFARPVLPHASHSLPNTVTEISDVIAELDNIMPPERGPEPKDHSTTITQGITDPVGSSPTRVVAPHRSSASSSTVSPAISSADSGPPLASTVLAGLPQPSQAPSIHAPDSSQRYSLSKQPAHQNAISIAATENHGEASAPEESQQAQKPASGAVVGRQSACTRGANTYPISQTGPRNGPHAEGLSHLVSASSPPQSAVSPLQSVTSSPAQSSVSLNRASSTTSSYQQPVSGIRRQQSDSISRSASVSTQPTSPDARPPGSSPSPAADVVLPKPKPFPMLPGQVTPMPSQIGSNPVPLRALPGNSVHAQSPSTPSSPRSPQSGETLSPVNPGPRQPTQNRLSLQAGPRTASSQMPPGSPYQPLPQTQVKPGQQGAPSRQSYHGPPSLPTAPATTRPPIPAQQPVQYPIPGPRTNGALAASYTENGVKKWAKKIFWGASPAPNAPIAGPPRIQGPIGSTNAAQPIPGASNNALIGSLPRQVMQHEPPGGHGQPQSALMQTQAPYQPAGAGMQRAPPMPLPTQGTLRACSGAGAEATGWGTNTVDYTGGDWADGW
ncbi:hypothetical protein DL764_003890 [Monosporascus ibericus]|uniref:WW domain-containing protein n=1 Tax=Monosporascus ibericus TaxID=155417 RepID=A0A4Q4TGK0_9PEZI|nr:hypothetical protein DL764_003890 [Monosporascus ibericus]